MVRGNEAKCMGMMAKLLENTKEFEMEHTLACLKICSKARPHDDKKSPDPGRRKTEKVAIGNAKKANAKRSLFLKGKSPNCKPVPQPQLDSQRLGSK
jgi:hypothetical protein